MNNSEQNLTDADKIRLKRLAKLQQKEQEQQQQQQYEQEQASNGRKSAIANKPVLQTLDEFVPAKRTVVKKAPATRSPTPGSPSQASQQHITKSNNIKAPSTSVVKPAKSFEDWQDDVLSRILQVTLNPENMYKQGKCVYLSSLANELIEEEDDHPNKLQEQHLDRIIVARLSLDPKEPHEDLPQDIRNTLNILHFDYLLNCWKTVFDIRRNTLQRSKNLEKSVLDQRLHLLDNVKNLIVSYSGLVLQMPDMFPQMNRY
ncbi:hypothetical protein BDF20DRAFT_476725 [Mycotypha africana]|uniref:uncharacterized protein n=1 Tax=Mycotypha africana TaxID=64632 RepID=UPI002301C70A|nr:uncharacterized protein BDF20DRAFT_476725 [Mycotypha africana]KAI8982486.1 hypothetical protein BDF20DRAFT_476725 [Mycotypha africana]